MILTANLASHCMRPPVWRPPTGCDWSGSADTSCGPPGRRPAADPRSRACRLRLEVHLVRRHLSDPPVAAGIAREAGRPGAATPTQPGPLPRRVGPQCQRQGAHRARAQSAGPGNGFAGQRRHIPPGTATPQTVVGCPADARVPLLSSAYVERCGGTVKVVAALTEPGAIRKYLPGVGLPARAPPMAPAGRRPQQEFDIDYAASAA